jgi:hypothetical protein
LKQERITQSIPEIKVIAETTIFGQHRTVAIYDAPDEETMFKSLVPYLEITTTKIMPAMTPEDTMKLVKS